MMRRIMICLALSGLFVLPAILAAKAQGAESGGQFEATVTMINNDTSPATTPGPGDITALNIPAFDCFYRSIFVEMVNPGTLSEIVLKNAPSTMKSPSGNDNLKKPGMLELYYSDDNRTFKKLRFKLSAPDKNTIVMHGFKIKARYLKVHYTGDSGNYKFSNILGKMIPTFVSPGAKRKNYYELEDPLFEPLLGDVPGPKRVQYWATNVDDEVARFRPWYRAHAKKFGQRYVLEEEVKEAAEHNLVCIGNLAKIPEFQKHGVLTWRFITGDEPGQAAFPSFDGAPAVLDGQCWPFDPRYFKGYVSEAVRKTKAKEQWGLAALDEMWDTYGIKVVPKEKRYDLVLEADKEIREKYGFGKYGMPESDADTNPFRRIAYRRWTLDKFTELFRQTYEAVKKVNPDMVLLAPDSASGVPAADYEAWAPYFDIFNAQCFNMPDPFLRKLNVGCDTKVMVDLCGGKRVWMAVQNAFGRIYGIEITPEDIRERYSQVFRNGGHGIMLLAAEWTDREMNHPKYAEPAKWRALLHVVDTMTHMNLPKLPKADSAILYSSDSLLSLQFSQMRNQGHWEIYSIYTILGPFVRSWFHFVSDRQIDRGIRNLNDYRVLYIPFADYGRASLLDKIEAYIKAGGIVVCTNTDSFTWDINGERLTKRWEKLSGVRRGEEKAANLEVTTVAAGAFTLPVGIKFRSPDRAWKLIPLDRKVTELAVFPDGSPAITSHQYGKGRVISFATDPFGVRNLAPLVYPESPVVPLFEAIQKAIGAKMGHDIWRFKFPPFPTDMYQKEKGTCLTNNYVYDRNEPLLEPNNIRTGGTYTYSRLPTGVADSVKSTGPISFTEGHLTNRLPAYESRRLYGVWDPSLGSSMAAVPLKWIVSWTDRAPVGITFDLKSEYPLSRAQLFYSGTMPEIKVSGSTDGKTWRTRATASQHTAGKDGKDVKDFALPLEGKYRYVKLDFAAREGGEKFELCEVEVWGEGGLKPPVSAIVPSEVPGSETTERRAAPAVWTLRFSDDFKRDELGSDWRVASGDWKIENGMLAAGTTGALGAKKIACTRKFPGSQRLEFDAMSERPCDLSVQLASDGFGSFNGYFFGFGSDNNVHSKLLIRQRMAMESETVINPGKLHHIVCERDGNKLTHTVDGKIIISFIDEPPLTGGTHQMIGFYIYTEGKIDNVKIYTKPEN